MSDQELEKEWGDQEIEEDDEADWVPEKILKRRTYKVCRFCQALTLLSSSEHTLFKLGSRAVPRKVALIR